MRGMGLEEGAGALPAPSGAVSLCERRPIAGDFRFGMRRMRERGDRSMIARNQTEACLH